MSTRTIVFAAACADLMFGCADAPRDTEDTQEIIDNLHQAGFPDGEITVSGGVVYVGRDAAVSLQASREMLEPPGSSTEEQYRTTNLVSRSLRTICVDVRICANHSSKLANALNLAIQNYTQLNLTFDLSARTTNFTGCDAIITCQLAAGVTGGSSGFPSGGLPFKTINIGTGLDSSTFSLDVVEHVVTHELGHTIGLRHTDFNQTISCGADDTVSEGDAGAILIPGTPTLDPDSIMNTCFRTITLGEFSSWDIVALNALYGL